VVENVDVNTAREKEEVHTEDVEMDDDHDVNPLKTEEVLQWCPAKDPFLVFIELKDCSTFMEHDISSSISNEVKFDENYP
ncbi:hypothetical protein Tco_1523608, partial [Tanacetum coccineum]